MTRHRPIGSRREIVLLVLALLALATRTWGAASTAERRPCRSAAFAGPGA